MLWVVDDFVEAQAERAKALECHFEDLVYEGFRYPGMSAPQQDDQSVDRISGLVGAPIKDATVLYRYYAKEMKQEGFIHSDASVAHYTGILFLSTPRDQKDGLALWQHKQSTTESFPDDEDLAEFGGWEKFRDDGFDESKWWMTEFVPMQLGRLVVFPGSRWHSRYPQPVDNFSVQDARLIKVFFCR